MLLVVAVLLAVGGYLAYDRFFKPQPVAANPTQQVAVTRGSIVATVSSTGSVVPSQTAALGFGDASTGRLAELKASVGDTVKEGDVLARLDTTDLQLELLKAESQLATAESNLATLQSGSSAAEIALARAQLRSAEANLEELRAGATAVEVQSAEASVSSARASLAKAETALSDLRAGPSVRDTNNALIALEKAKISIQNAQAAYDKVSWRPDVGSSPEAMALWQATVDYEAAEESYNTAMAGATAEDLVVAEQGVTTSRAQLASAEAALAKVNEGATGVDLASAEAAVLQAQAQLEDTLNPTTPAQIQAAEASVEQARIAVQSARNNLDKATIVAPFAGAVAAVSGTIGQQVSGTVITLLDMSSPEVQITLVETDVAKVAVGQDATLTFEALGNGMMLGGKVTAITPEATVSSGVATYAATVSIDGLARVTPGSTGFGAGQVPAATGMMGGQGRAAGQRPGNAGATPAAEQQAGEGQEVENAQAGAPMEERAATAEQTILSQVKPGMTASVTIEHLRKDDVLLVPNRAISAQGRDRVVEVLVADGQTETRVVTTGASNDDSSEILTGLEEGDQVVYTVTTTSSSTAPNIGQQGFGIGGGDLPPGGGMPGGGMPGDGIRMR